MDPVARFDNVMIVARCRDLLQQEAQMIALRLRAGEALTAQRLMDELLLAVGRCQPRSRLIPWGLTDRAVEAIARRVVEHVLKETGE